MKAEYSLDLRFMKGKEVYKGKEVRLLVQNQAESYQQRRWRITAAVRLFSPAGAPDLAPKHASLYKGLGMLAGQSQANEKSLFQPNLSCTSVSSNEKGGSVLRLFSPQTP